MCATTIIIPLYTVQSVHVTYMSPSVQLYAYREVMDAVRIRDGCLVLLKRFKLPADGRKELEVNTLLSSEPLKSNPRNPALPMLDVVYAPDQCFMVFPFGQRLYDMEFHTIGEGLDLVEQTLKVRNLIFLDSSVLHVSKDHSGYYISSRERNRASVN